MISSRIKIGDGSIVDMYTTYGFCYLSSDNIVGAPIKDFEKTTYPEQEGENIYSKTVFDAFDYKVKFLIEAPNGTASANKKIADFNAALYAQSGDILTMKRVTFYNDYKKVKVYGYASPISAADSFYRDKNGNEYDAVQVELTIRVDDPSQCDFNISAS